MSTWRAVGLTMLVASTVGAGEPQLADTGVFSFRNGFGGIFPRATPPLAWVLQKSTAWKYRLEHRSNASPIIVGDKVFVLDDPAKLVCLRASDGHLLWERDNSLEAVLGIEASGKSLPKPSWLSSYGYTTPTPVSDGRRLWCVFGQGVVVCYDLDGQRLWAQPIDVMDKVAGLAASPCLVDGVLVVSAKGRDRLCGFDAETGKKLWSLDEGVQDGSSVPFVLNRQTLVATSAGLIIEPQSGRIIARGLLGGPLDGDTSKEPVNWGPTVAVENGWAIFHVHFQPDKVEAALRGVRLGLPGACEQRWEVVTNRGKDLLGRMGNSPVMHSGLLYAVNDGGMLQVLDVNSGHLEYSQQLPRQSYASLALAGGYLFAFGLQRVTVFKVGRRYEEVSQFAHEFSDFYSSPVFVGRRLYFRDAQALWCVEQAVDDATSSMPGNVAPENGVSPSLADTAKNAPLIPYQEWLLLHDYSRLRARSFSRIIEWSLVAVAILLVGWRMRRAHVGMRWIASGAMISALCFPLGFLAGVDRWGNPFLPVSIWSILGGMALWLYAEGAIVRQSNLGAKLSRVPSILVGAVIGAGVGIVAHQLPLLLLTVWHIMTGRTI